MNALEYAKKVGWSAAEGVAVRAGTTPAYFRQIAHGFRRPSIRLAERLAEASAGEMDLLSLLQYQRRTKDQRAA